MKKLLLAALAVGAVALNAPVASASHTGYAGGCSFATLNDTTPDGQLGGQNQWNGEIDVLVASTDAAGVPTPYSISAECELLINGVSQGIVLAAPQNTGVTGNGSSFSFTAAEDAVVTLCDIVVVDGETHRDCGDAETTQIVPQPVIDLIDLIINALIDATYLPDETICPILAAFNDDVPGVFETGADGDTYIGGEFFWDCPPYVTTP